MEADTPSLQVREVPLLISYSSTMGAEVREEAQMRLEIFRHAKVGTLVAGIGVAVAAGAANEGRLSVEALTALIRDADVPKDRDIFVALPSQSQLAERPFSLDLPLKHDRVPGWSYDAYEQTLIVRPGPNLYTVHHRLPPKFAKASRDRNAEGYVILDQVISPNRICRL